MSFPSAFIVPSWLDFVPLVIAQVSRVHHTAHSSFAYRPKAQSATMRRGIAYSAASMASGGTRR